VIAPIHGVVGQIKWAYFNAAAVNGYAVMPVGKGRSTPWKLTANVIAVDRFKLSQRPLYFAAPFSGGVLRWAIVKFELQGDRLIADLGPLES
jgi:hypothetical protein